MNLQLPMEKNQVITTPLPVCGTNETITAVLMSFQLSRWLFWEDFIAIEKQP